MSERITKTSHKVKIGLIVGLGIAAFLVFIFLLYNFTDILGGLMSDKNITYQGKYDEINISTNPMVTAAAQEIEGRPEIRTTDPKTGSANPEINLVWFGSFGSGYTAAAQPIIKEIMDAYGDRIQLVWKDYYNQSDLMSTLGAQAARCAQSENKFWEMHQEIFNTRNGFDRDEVISLAEKIGLTKDEFTECLDSDQVKGMINVDLSDGLKLNLPGAPIFFIGDAQPVIGVITTPEFKALIDQELKK